MPLISSALAVFISRNFFATENPTNLVKTSVILRKPH